MLGECLLTPHPFNISNLLLKSSIFEREGEEK
jgi:hypothetical protein